MEIYSNRNPRGSKIGSKLRDIRSGAGSTQKEFIAAAELPISTAFLSRIENGLRLPTDELLRAVAKWMHSDSSANQEIEYRRLHHLAISDPLIDQLGRIEENQDKLLSQLGGEAGSKTNTSPDHQEEAPISPIDLEENVMSASETYGAITARREARLKKSPNTPRTPVVGQWGCGYRDFDEDLNEYRNRVLRGLDRRPFRIPGKYLYQLEGGCEAWLKMCDLPQYTYYQSSLSGLRTFAGEIIEQAIRATGDREFDYVSLGCGDGVKDSILLWEMKSRLEDIETLCYYPVDISALLINKAAQGLKRNHDLLSKVAPFYIEGDICSLPSYSRYYEEFAGNNFFSILGNTIGNNDEANIFTAIDEAMGPGDIVLFEVNTDQKGAREQRTLAGDRDKNWERHTLPLTALRVDVRRDQVEYKVYERRSIVPETVTVQAVYKSFELDGILRENVVLSNVHHYDLHRFISVAETRMNLTRIWSAEHNGVGFLLAKKN